MSFCTVIFGPHRSRHASVHRARENGTAVGCGAATLEFAGASSTIRCAAAPAGLLAHGTLVVWTRAELRVELGAGDTSHGP